MITAFGFIPLRCLRRTKSIHYCPILLGSVTDPFFLNWNKNE